MTLFIKNMVCRRCIMAVETIFEKAGVDIDSVTLGEVELRFTPSEETLAKISAELQSIGFELIGDRKSRLIEKIKSSIIHLVHHREELINKKLSDYIAEEVAYDYHYLSNLFSEVEGITIEKYFIAQRLEKAKELLMYDELSLAEIADRLGYSSTAYLSNQFRRHTGLTPSFYRKMKEKSRRNIEDL